MTLYNLFDVFYYISKFSIDISPVKWYLLDYPRDHFKPKIIYSYGRLKNVNYERIKR